MLKEFAHSRMVKRVARAVGVYPYPRTHSRHLLKLLRHLRINCVLDVGAHYGEFGALLREFGYCRHIVSFEPVSASYKLLQARAERDGKWTTFPFGLAAADGTAEIHLYRSSDFNSLLEPSGVQDRFAANTEELGTETVILRRLDSVFGECLAGIAEPRVALKMDTQGYDLEVVRGAHESLKSILMLQSELPGISHYAGQAKMIPALEHYWAEGFRPTGFFPVNYETDGVTVMEWDCVLMREDAGYAPAIVP